MSKSKVEKDVDIKKIIVDKEPKESVKEKPKPKPKMVKVSVSHPFGYKGKQISGVCKVPKDVADYIVRSKRGRKL